MKIPIDVTKLSRYYVATYMEVIMAVDDLTNPQDESLQMILEQWPGGRWFRDRGNGIGHLWGHVQGDHAARAAGIERLSVHGVPGGESYRSEARAAAGGIHVDFRHRAIGFIDPAHRQGVTTGWKHMLDRVAEDCSAHADGQGS